MKRANVDHGIILWMDEILHHLETMVETIVCWYLQGNQQKPGFLRWCEMDFVHPQYHLCTPFSHHLFTPSI